MRLRGCLSRPRLPATWLGRLFAGQHGVRTGWRLGLFLALLLVPLAPEYFLVVALNRASPGMIKPPFHADFILLNEAVFLLPLCMATLVMAFLEDRGFAQFGLRDRRWRGRLIRGLALGVAALALLLASLRMLGLAHIGSGGLPLLGDLRYGAEWLAVSILIGLTEEYMYRGYFLATLAGGIGFWPAALVSSALFALTHASNHGEAFTGLLQVATIGLFFCFSLRRTGSLWCAIGVHAGWDYAENFLFGTRDSGVVCFGTLLTTAPHGNPLLSGGDVGPEGSLLSLIVPLLLTLVVARLYPVRAHA